MISNEKLKILYKYTLINCISVLIILFVLKLLGIDLIKDVDTLNKLINISTLIDNSEVLSFIASMVFYFCNLSIISMICLKTRNIEYRKVFIISVFVIMINCLINNGIMSLIVDLICLFPILYKKCTFKRYIKVMFCLIIYQIVSLYVKDMNFQVGNFGFYQNVIYMIDYYIILLFCYLHYKKEVD